MKVKRYLVNDLPEAVQMIRSELGSDAVILNTKEIRSGGFLGMFRKKRVEVIAAVDESAAKPKPRPAVSAQRSPAAALAFASSAAAVALAPEREPEPEPMAAPPSAWIPPAAVRERYNRGSVDSPPPPPKAAGAALEVLAGRAELSAAAPPAVAAEAASPPAPAAVRPIAAAERSNVLRRPAETEPAGEDETDALLKEIRSMKEMMMKMNRQQTFRRLPDPVMQLAKKLAKHGVEPAYVEQFAEAVGERTAGEREPSEQELLEAGREVLREWLAPAVGTGIAATTRIVHFVGPTGVGKTTTIAKLAADQAFVHRRSVGFITADTYRIAAVDQLRTYADILNMPLEVVFSPSELTRAYKKLEDRDLLLMDTAGRNYRNELFVSEVNSLLLPGEQAESVLVLSLTHKYDDMKQVAGQFSQYGVNRLLLTKMDETDSFGAVLNLARDFDFSISYVTCGQTVPDDIRAFDPEEIIRRLLGEPGDA
ncbi:flagellar biosynthesis protein FlhF [Cohnella thermotolerans]|uniref:flagellar biosynthesis protein FlhF n=1 Tax=Cohnella thermotolerans TaxID=329858 RepID=UPI00040D9267|nr:flagellar biosynthesis protein FlhF [Cohnella thermotolerans]